MRGMNKAQERAIVQQLLASLSNAPTGALEDSEEPDFIVCSAGIRIGVEVTELYERRREGNAAAAEFHQVNVVIDRAQDMAQAQGVPPACVVVEFAIRGVSKRRAPDLASELVAIVKGAMPAHGQCRTLCQTYMTSSVLPVEIDQVDIMRLEDHMSPSWTQIDAAFANQDLVGHLQGCMDRKRPKHATYLKRCDKCWLVMYGSGLPGVAFFAPDAPIETHKFFTPFERAFYFNGFSGHPVELLLAGRTASE